MTENMQPSETVPIHHLPDIIGPEPKLGEAGTVAEQTRSLNRRLTEREQYGQERVLYLEALDHINTQQDQEAQIEPQHQQPRGLRIRVLSALGLAAVKADPEHEILTSQETEFIKLCKAKSLASHNGTEPLDAQESEAKAGWTPELSDFIRKPRSTDHAYVRVVHEYLQRTSTPEETIYYDDTTIQRVAEGLDISSQQAMSTLYLLVKANILATRLL